MMENISLCLQIQQPTQHEETSESVPVRNHPPPTLAAAALPAAMLHSVRKPPAKPWKRPEMAQPKVYHVEPRGFRKLVQELTGAPKRTAKRTPPNPPPLDLAPPATRYDYSDATTTRSLDDRSLMGMISSSQCSPYASWCPFPLLSPGTMASFSD